MTVKKFAGMLAASVMAASLMGQAVFAAGTETGALPALTIDDAVKYTLAADTSYLNLLDTGKQNLESRTDTLNNYFYGYDSSSDGSDWIRTSVQLMQIDAQIALQSSNEQQKRLSLQNTLTKYFMNIMSAEKSLELSALSLENTLADLNILKTKVKLGLASQSELAAAEAGYAKANNENALKETGIASAYTELNRLMGKPAEDRYSLVLEYEYAPLGEIDLEQLISKATSQSASIKQKQSDLEVAEYKLEDAWWIYTSSTEYNNNDLKTDIIQAQRSLADEKESLRNTITDACNDIKSLEVEIATNQLELDSMKAQKAIKEVQLQLGKTTALEVKKYEVQILQLEETLRQQVYSHQLTMWQFENPSVLGGGTAGTSTGSAGA